MEETRQRPSQESLKEGDIYVHSFYGVSIGVISFLGKDDFDYISSTSSSEKSSYRDAKGIFLREREGQLVLIAMDAQCALNLDRIRKMASHHEVPSHIADDAGIG